MKGFNERVVAGALCVLSAALLSACATPTGGEREAYAGADDPRRGDAVDTVCFGGRLSGFYEVGDEALVLRRTSGESYLAETGFCPKLRLVEGVRIVDGARCLQRGDRLEVYDTALPRQGASSDRPDRCLVRSIYKWDETALESDDS